MNLAGEIAFMTTERNGGGDDELLKTREDLRKLQWHYHDLMQERNSLAAENVYLKHRTRAVELSSTWRVARFFLDRWDSIRKLFHFSRRPSVSIRGSNAEDVKSAGNATILAWLPDPGKKLALVQILLKVPLIGDVRLAVPCSENGILAEELESWFSDKLSGRPISVVDASGEHLVEVFLKLAEPEVLKDAVCLVIACREADSSEIRENLDNLTSQEILKAWDILRENDDVEIVSLKENPGSVPPVFWARSDFLRSRLAAGIEDDPELTAEAGRAVSLEDCLAPSCVVDTKSHILQAMRFRSRNALKSFMDDGEVLSFFRPENPLVSIIVVVYNQADLTLECLKSILAIEFSNYELILFDNNSGDETSELFARVKGARIIKNTTNIGFLKAVNHAVAAAEGEFLLLLNNDAMPEPDAVSRAVSVMKESCGIGAVGGKILRPDGSLQEAGSITWNNAVNLEYGRGQDPDSGAFQFRRDVDYCCGAFLLLRRAQFLEMDGFDEAFSPAYYEENDFCLRLRKAGFRVVYEPAIRVRHYERASSPSREACDEGMKKNREIFYEKHREFLAGHHLPEKDENILLARSADRNRTRLLLIDDLLPISENGAGFPRTAAILGAINGRGYQVTYYSTEADKSPDWELIWSRFPIGVEFILDRGNYFLADFLTERKGCYDLVWICRPHNQEKFIQAFSRVYREGEKRPAVIYDAEAVYALRDIAAAEVRGERLSAVSRSNLIQKELELAGPSDAVAAVSEKEARLFRDGFPGKLIAVLGHSFDPEGYQARGFTRRGHILFTGRIDRDGSPNVDSIRWFIKEVFPGIRDWSGGRIKFIVVGKVDERLFRGLNMEGVELKGEREDLSPYTRNCRVFVAPTRFAAGIPLKLIDAAAAGIPAVCTPILAEQLGWDDEREALLAGQADDFAGQVCRLYQDQVLWQSIREQAYSRVENDFSPGKFKETIAKFVSSVNNAG